MPKPAKTWYEIRNAASGKPAQLTIEGYIGGYGVTSQQFRADFGRLGENEALQIHVMSGGGSIVEGNEIANIIGGHKGRIDVTLGSICGSIATVIACAGETVTAAKNTIYMIHNPSVGTDGDAKDLRKTAEILDLFHETIVNAYKEKTGLPEAEILAMMDAETWMTPAKAKAKGFIDSIGDEDAEDDAIDRVDLSSFRNSAILLSRLNVEPAERGVNAGNGGRLTLEAIRNAATTRPPTQQNSEPAPKTNMKTPEEIAAEKAANDAAIKAGVRAALDARNARDKEIKAAVSLIAKRDKRDVSDIADAIFGDDTKTLADFHAAVNSSPDFKPAKGSLVIGAGFENHGGNVQVFEPLDSLRGTAGFNFVTSDSFRAMHEDVKRNGTHRPGINLSIDVPRFLNATQTSTATSGSGLTSIEKVPGLVDLAVRPLTIEDLVMPGQTGATTIRLMQEVTHTQAAAAVTETGALANFGVTYTEVDFPVKDMGGYIEASENLLADYLAVASLINTRLPYQVDRVVEDEIFNGSGSGAHVTGILQTAGIQSLALGVIDRADFPLKLQTLVRWQAMTSGQAQGGFEPDAYVIHPTDWETLQLLKDDNGQYFWRGPFTGSYGVGGATVEFNTLWGKRVVVSPVVAQGTIVCGAFRMGAQKFDRQGMTIEMTNTNGTNFINRLITMRGTRRLALAVMRPGSFVTGTGF